MVRLHVQCASWFLLLLFFQSVLSFLQGKHIQAHIYMRASRATSVMQVVGSTWFFFRSFQSLNSLNERADKKEGAEDEDSRFGIQVVKKLFKERRGKGLYHQYFRSSWSQSVPRWPQISSRSLIFVRTVVDFLSFFL